MAKFFVNGKEYELADDKKVMSFLRDDLRLLSVKDGCSEGACGSCTVLADNIPVKVCVQTAKRMDGKHILTVEGLSNREKDVFKYAFGKAGAVQCGFCIPGMVMCAKALIDKNNNPTRIECADAIKNNYCRCTGYKKIIDAIILAAKVFRENLDVITEAKVMALGESDIRVDAPDKIMGTAKYADDIYLDNMIYGSCVRSKYPRARVKSIDIEEAKKLEGVVGILTAKDLPGKMTGHLKKDWFALIDVGDITHSLGDAIVAVYAKDKETLERAKALVKIDYEVLPAVFDRYEALKADAPIVHEEEDAKTNVLVKKHIKRGNPDAAIENAKYKVTRTYKTPWTEHAFLEPECAVAMPLHDGSIMIYSSDQSVYDTRRECSNITGLPEEKIIVENSYVGGAFGGKEDMTIQPLTCVAAMKFGVPVKMKLTRAESMQLHPKRHPMDVTMTTACDENGILVGMKCDVVSDTGCYASLGGPVLERACTHAAGPYNYQNIEINGTAVYTNNPPAGAFRGFGVTQTCFATEMNINLLADMVGIDYYEIRRRNAIKPGDVLPNGQIADESTGLIETLEAVKDYYYSDKYVGIACAMKNAGVGVGLPDYGRCKIVIKDGNVEIHAGASENGQGIGQVLIQTVSNELKISTDKILWKNSNSGTDPDSGCSSGSRHTLITGEACLRATKKLKKDYDANGCDLSILNEKEYVAEFFEPTDKLGADKEFPVSHIGYGFATQLCILNDDGTIKELIGAHEVGKAINKLGVEGQIEGGMVMSMGYALTEDLKVIDGKVNAKYGTYGLLRANVVPKLTSIVVEKAGMKFANGAIGCGEITAIPTAPAIALAYYRKDKEFRTELPLANTPYSIK
ncbi:MAG: selenium-dependent xanthine dehydrogenase [Lachnospiraceae bacterium]|nr:selenium-dependent xanthine dehydrogenase [Lachnospiraceae bacterium]